jgi:hypothetical protein
MRERESSMRSLSRETVRNSLRLAPIAVCCVCSVPASASAFSYSPQSSHLPASLIQTVVQQASPAEANDTAARNCERAQEPENMALGEGVQYLRSWKLIPNPLPREKTGAVPEHSPKDLDALRKDLDLQVIRIFLPKEKTTFQSFDLQQHYPNAKESLAYGLTHITAEVSTTTTLKLRTANGVRVWINGELALSQPAPRSGKPVTHSAEVRLDAGKNIFLVECVQGERSWGFSLGLTKSQHHQAAAKP